MQSLVATPGAAAWPSPAAMQSLVATPGAGESALAVVGADGAIAPPGGAQPLSAAGGAQPSVAAGGAQPYDDEDGYFFLPPADAETQARRDEQSRERDAAFAAFSAL
jgi:hypothetical protein